MFFLNLLSFYNSNDGIVWFAATLGTAALGSPVVLAAIISGLFVTIGKLIERRTYQRLQAEMRARDEKRDAQITGLLASQNTLLMQITQKETPHPGTGAPESVKTSPDFLWLDPDKR